MAVVGANVAVAKAACPLSCWCGRLGCRRARANGPAGVLALGIVAPGIAPDPLQWAHGLRLVCVLAAKFLSASGGP
jgi:hypothetical protein